MIKFILTILLSLFIIFGAFKSFAGQRIRVLSIDTGVDKSHEEINSHLPRKIHNPLNYMDTNGHGTHVAGIILKGTCKEVKLHSCTYFDIGATKGSSDLYYECLKLAVKLKPDVLNLSSGGDDFNQAEYDILSILSNMGVKIVVAAGNDHKDLSKIYNNYYPAKYKIANLIPVGNLNQDKSLSIYSNYGLLNEDYEIGENVNSTLPQGKYGKMSGTSQATAVKTNKILLELCKHERN